jgi:hypothetical protein
MFNSTGATAALNGPAANGQPAFARIICKFIVLLFAAIAGSAAAAERISAVRVWPAQDYTRITIESDRPIRHELLLVKNPDRLVLDLDGVDFASVQKEISDKVLPGDPYIAQMRAGRYKPGVVRMVLDLKNKEFVEAARVRGEKRSYILFREILPNSLPPLLVEASMRFSYSIFLVAALGYLGLGVQPPSPDWGLQINEARNFFQIAPWVLLFPACTIAVLVISTNLMSDGLRQVMLPGGGRN